MAKNSKRIDWFEKETELKLKPGKEYDLSDVSITTDNKMLLTDLLTLYVYTDCKYYEQRLHFPAVVTLPGENSIQFVNTKSMTKGDKVNIGFTWYGITAGREMIYVGGTHGSIQTLDNNGTILKSFQQESEGAPVYSKNVSGLAGLACDRQGNIYYGGFFDSNINRMTSNWKNCEEMINEEDGIEYPYGMCFNNDFTKLFVINNDSNSVYVYKCKHMMNC
ncbi:Hypothetical predicted protein [Mytilus galloprovincialis]|uniref:Uncharacterized protein n=1 Tax=Mytilus galloprovincialis TaxID=29158 RepID=A0A8B6C838_MYTGA|nr:Hypothetical predicted protein [Mytilus galloprovincialis]